MCVIVIGTTINGEGATRRRKQGERQSGCAHSIQHSRNASSHVTKRYKEWFLYCCSCLCLLWLAGRLPVLSAEHNNFVGGGRGGNERMERQ